MKLNVRIACMVNILIALSCLIVIFNLNLLFVSKTAKPSRNTPLQFGTLYHAQSDFKTSKEKTLVLNERPFRKRTKSEINNAINVTTFSIAHITKKNKLKPNINANESESAERLHTLEPAIQGYLREASHQCDSQFIGYGHSFAVLRNVVVNPRFGQGKRGGENISDVIGQSESAEYYTLKKGYFVLKCNYSVNYAFHPKSHLNEWIRALDVDNRTREVNAVTSNGMFAIAVKRFEYANLYHTATDFYNAFLMTKLLNLNPKNVTIFFLDGHPFGALDGTWATLFSGILRAGDIKYEQVFPKMIWSIIGYNSMLNDHQRQSVPRLDEFRLFFLDRHGVQTTKRLDCSNLTLMFLWRRDYLAHPRNPSGLVSRKIANEDELTEAVKAILPGHKVHGVQLDLLRMKEQLQLVANTDILIGMHGAGLTHALFLPNHAGLVELYPSYWSTANIHFQTMARWRRLTYFQWQNFDFANERPKRCTYIPKDVVISLVNKTLTKMCGQLHSL